MKQHKLLILLESLDLKEWKRLKRYILTKTKRPSELYILFENFEKTYKKGLPLDIDTLKNKEFSGIARKSLLNMCSTLKSWAEEFILIEDRSKHTIETDLQLLKIYNGKGLYPLADQLFNRLEKQLQQLDENHERRNKLFSELYFTYYYSNNPIKYKNNRGTQLLRSLVEAHQGASSQYGLLYLAELHNWGKITRTNFDHEIEILIRLTDGYESHPYLHHLIKMIKETDFQSFKILRTKLFESTLDTYSMIFTATVSYMVNYVMKFWQQGDLKNSSEIVEIYEFGLNTGVLLINGRIPENRFHNIISTVGGLSNNDWSLQFIKKWGDKVNSKNASQNVDLGMAQYYFYKNQYQKITPLLRSLKFDPLGQQIRLMGLQLIAWYEEAEEAPDMFLTFSETFEKYLKRHKSNLSNHYFLSHLNLIKILRGLFKRTELLKLQTIMESSQSIIYRTYLMKKMESNPPHLLEY